MNRFVAALPRQKIIAPKKELYLPSHRLLCDPARENARLRVAPFGPSVVPLRMGPARVQGGGTATDTTATTVAVTLTNTVGVGNSLFGGFSWDTSGGATVSITDDKSNVYTILDLENDTSEGQEQKSFYCLNILNSPKTITVTFSVSSSYRALIVDEFSGISALDVHTSNLQTSVATTANAITTGNETPTANGDLIYGVQFCTSDSITPSVGSGFTAGTTLSGSGDQLGSSEYLVQSSAASIAATWTAGVSGQNWASFLMAFKPADSFALDGQSLIFM